MRMVSCAHRCKKATGSFFWQLQAAAWRCACAQHTFNAISCACWYINKSRQRGGRPHVFCTSLCRTPLPPGSKLRVTLNIMAQRCLIQLQIGDACCAKRRSSSCLQLRVESNTNAQVNFTARLSHTKSSQMVKSNRAPSTLYLLCMGLLGHRPSGCVGTFAIVPSSWNVQWWYGHVIHLRSPIRSTVPALRGAARWLHASSIATRVPPIASPEHNAAAVNDLHVRPK